jgi:hypothetical protein
MRCTRDYGSSDISLLVCAHVNQDLRIVNSPNENSTPHNEIFFLLDYKYYVAAMKYTKNFIVIMFSWFFLSRSYK